MAARTKTPPPIVQEAMTKFEEAKGHHDAFVRTYERRERAYKGILTSASNASRWNHKIHPPYAFNLLETVIANTVEMGLRFDVRPAPHVNPPLEEAQQMLAQAEAMSDLLRHEHRLDEMDYKQRPLFLTAAIGGRGIGKCYWNYTEGAIRRQGVQMQSVTDEEGNELLQVPTITEIVEDGILRDHSTFEVVDPRDFILHESAKSLQPYEPGGAQHIFHRCWYSFEQLKMMEAAGFLQNVDALKEQRDKSDEYSDRGKTVYAINRTKDLIEVLEYWCFKNGQVYRTLLSGDVLLRDEEASPFWHGGYPFIVASGMPQPFTTVGTSEIELIEQLQEMLWELMNQRLDNIELINNFITLIRSDVDDPDAFEAFPGARWLVDDTKQVESFQPPYQLSEVTLQAEALLKGDLQNVTSAAPFASGAETATVDQKTATGASIVMNAAQQRLQVKKYEYQRGLKQEANIRLKNCQQFISDTRLVHILGEDGKTTFRELNPLEIQGEFIAELEPMSESMMRQEKRAEAVQLSQVLLQAAPLAAAAGVPLNVREVIKWTLEKWDIHDSDRFFSQDAGMMGAAAAGGAPGAAGAPPGAAGAPPGAGGPPQDVQGAMQPNLGITAPPAPGAGQMGGPVTMLQRALAMGGGVSNA